MTEVYNEEILFSSYPTSPRPRRQPMTSLSTNRRSYSRLSSKGVFGDDSPLLLSPLPRYPNRRRSITFADETETTVREERPHYTMWEAGATPNARSSESPIGRSILSLKANNCGTDVCLNGRNHHHSATTTEVAAAAMTPTPKRARSNSRLRRAARRKEAELCHGFYDDSFVEEYVLKAKKDIEGECREEPNNNFDENMNVTTGPRKTNKECEKNEENEGVAAKINALQKAKEYLLSTVNTRRSFSACPSSVQREVSAVPRSRRQVSRKEHDLLLSIDEEGEEKTEEVMRQRKPNCGKCSVPLVTHVDDVDNAGSKKRVRQSSLKKEACLASKHQSGYACLDVGQYSKNDYGDEDSNDEGSVGLSKKTKLERIIARVIKQQAKRTHGKRSVVVIDWDSVDSENLLGDEADDVAVTEEYDKGYGCKKSGKATKAPPRSRKGVSVNKSFETSQQNTTAPALIQQHKPQAAVAVAPACSASAFRGPSSRRRNGAASVSIAPDLGGDSLLLEEEQPVLLRRHTTTKRHVPTRSISHVSAEGVGDAVFEQLVDVSRRPPQRAPAPRAARRGRRAMDAPGAAPSFPTPSVSPPTAPTTHLVASAPSLPHAAVPRRRAATQKTSAVAASSDDPMAIFFDASFPSPSKFDEMMLAAGGLPEMRGQAGRKKTRQPALLLPDNIYRRR